MAFLVRKLHLLEDLYYFCDADESISEDLEKTVQSTEAKNSMSIKLRLIKKTSSQSLRIF